MPPEPPLSRVDVRLVPAALLAWAVTAAGIAWGLGWWLAALGAGLGLAWWLSAMSSRHKGIRTASAAVIGAAIIAAAFGLSTALRCEAVEGHPLRTRVGTLVWVTVEPVEIPRRAGPARVMFRGDLTAVGDAHSTGAVTVFAPGVDFGQLGPGQPARFKARVSRPGRRNLTVANLTATGRPEVGPSPVVQQAARTIRDRFAAAARAALPVDQAAMLPGLVLGDTSAVPAAVIAEFRVSGLTHLTAVSGANVTIVCAAMLLFAYLTGPRIAVGLAALALTAFVVVVGPSASVVRAAVMAAIGLLAILTGRRRQAIPVLAATVIALLALAPQLAVDIGFALSVSATAALVVLAPPWSARLVGRGWPKVIADAVCIAAVAQLVTAPLIAAISGRFSLVSVLANLLVAVVVAPITLLGTTAAALAYGWQPGAELLIRFTGPELWWLLKVAQVGAGLPGASIPVPSGWAGVGVVGSVSAASILLWRWRAGRWSVTPSGGERDPRTAPDPR